MIVMIKKVIIGGFAAVSLSLLLAGCGTTKTDSSQQKADESTAMSSSTSMSSAAKMQYQAGEIIGNYNSDDKKVLGATRPGETVEFKVPVSDKEEYLHFAFMHAASGEKGWYFAPKSEDGISLNKDTFKDNMTMDITKDVALFAAPNETTAMMVSKDDGSLKYGDSDKFMQATVALKDDMYVVTIKNISAGDMETPFSSGVWGVTDTKEKGFDHMASKELSTLATSGHRDDLYKKVSDK
ncbi:hypothetical protein RV01_GL001497 [Enterococcus dispar]|nr:hypothetical protein RV01_GL001497 [Enterococcus dispar]